MAEIKDILTRLKNYIDQEDNNEQIRAEKAEEALGSRINQEISDRTTADAAELNRATKAEADLQENINDEAETRASADNALQTNIEAEKNRATAKENKIVDGLTAEITRATEAEEVLTTNITAEITRATKAEERIEAKLDDRIDSLNLEQVGAGSSYIKYISQENGKVSAVARPFDTDFAIPTDNNVPTTQAVKTYIDTTINALDKEEEGADGYYIKKVKEDNGVITATKQQFDQSVSETVTHGNAPTTKAVKDYVDNVDSKLATYISKNNQALAQEIQDRKDADTKLDTRIDGLDLDTVGQNGYYIKTITQSNGQVSATTEQIENEWSVLSHLRVPSSKLVKDTIEDEAERARGAEQTLATNLTAEATARSTEDARLLGLINSGSGTLDSKIDAEIARATSKENEIVATVNALDLQAQGIAGQYIRTVSQTDGQVTATPVNFDSDFDNPSNNNAPTTKAVNDRFALIDEAGTTFTLTMNQNDYRLTLTLKNRNGYDLKTETIDLPLESVVVGGRYDESTKSVILTLQDSSTISFSVADLVAGLQSEINENNKLNSDLVDDTNSIHKFVTANEKTQITTNQNAIAAIKDGNILDSFRDVEDELNKKVDKISGKGLSANDYTDEAVANVAANTLVRHSHTNKDLLDTYTQTEANLAVAVANTHTHNNKAILDATTESFTTAYKNQLDATAVSVDYDGTKLYKTLPTGQGSDIVSVSTLKTDMSLDKVTNDRQVKGLASGTTEDHILVFGADGYTVKDSGKTLGDTGKIDSITINGVATTIENRNVDLPAYPTRDSLEINNVNNTSDEDKPLSKATREALDGKVDKIEGKGLSTIDFTDTNYVHTDNNYTTVEKNKLAGIEAGAQVNSITGIKGSSETSYRTGNISISKDNIGLGNVDNTSDMDKPISNATKQALDLKANKSDVYTKSETYTKTETDTRIAEKLDEKQTTEVNCSHEVEITGFGEEDCNLAIDDQDVVITKIQGQTRRKSANLCKLNSDITIIAGTEKWYFINTDTLKSWGLVVGNTYTIIAYDTTNNELAYQLMPNYNGFKNEAFRFTFSENIAFRIGGNAITSETTFTPKIMLVEGTYTTETIPPFEPYDNTLVNSKCDFVSTGRNLCNGTLEFNNTYLYVIRGCRLKPNTIYTISSNLVLGDNFIVTVAKNAWDESIKLLSSYSNFPRTFTTPSTLEVGDDWIIAIRGTFTNSNNGNIMLNYGDTALPYEPYVEDTMQCGIELGAFDYHDNVNHITHRQTSEMITLNGNENWIIRNNSNLNGLKVFAITLEKSEFNKWDSSIGISNNGYDVRVLDNGYARKNVISIFKKELCIASDNITTVEDFKSWLQTNPITFVYKLATETTEENILASGYKVWYKGMQIQKTNTIPYILTKQYAISLASQVLNNVSIDRSQQKQIDNLKKEIDLKANKEDTQNAINKSLYNLGAFDTISGNVITRQTGYVDLGKLDYESNSGSFPSNSVYFPISSAKPNGRLSLSSSSLFDKVYFDTSSNLILLLNNTYNNANDLKSALSGIILQYELATPYTEEIIEGQPLITLDQQGSQWLRSEWEKGLNLLDVPNKTRTKDGITFTISNGVINVNGSSADSTYPTCPINSVELQAGTYTINKSIDNQGLYIWVGSNLGKNDIVDTPSISATFTITTNMIVYITIVSTSLQTYSNFKFSLMLTKSSHALPYQPYNSKAHITNYDADFLKEESLKSANLFDKDNVFVGDINSTNGVLIKTTGFMASDYIEIKPNTTYSNNLKIKSFSSTGLAFYDSNKNYISGTINNSSAYNKFTTPSNAKYLRLSIDESYSQPYDDINNVMLNEGTKPLPYQEYNGSIVREKQLKELDNKIGDISAILDILNGEVL